MKCLINTLEIQYSIELTYQYSFLCEFFCLCGIFVYDGKDRGITEKRENSPAQLARINLDKSMSLNDEYLKIKTKLRLNSIEERYMDWLWNLYYTKDTQKDLFFILFKKRSFPDAKIDDNEIEIMNHLLQQMETQEYKCYSQYYGIVQLRYCLCEEKKSKGSDLENELRGLSLACHKAQLLEKEAISLKELMGDIYINIANDHNLGLAYYEQSITDYNYKVLRKIAWYYETRIVNPRRELQYLERTISCRKEYYEAQYRLARKLEQEQLKFISALERYEMIANILGSKQRIEWLTPEEFLVLCRTWKRIGCISYRYLQVPACEYGLQMLHNIYKLYGNCDKNKFILKMSSEMEPKRQKEIVSLYQSLYSIDHVQRSESNIIRKMEECRK